MKSRIFNFLFVFAFSAWSASAYSARPYYYLTINVNNILIHKGKMHIGIYNNEQDFDNKKYYAGTITDVKGKTFKTVCEYKEDADGQLTMDLQPTGTEG